MKKKTLLLSVLTIATAITLAGCSAGKSADEIEESNTAEITNETTEDELAEANDTEKEDVVEEDTMEDTDETTDETTEDTTTSDAVVEPTGDWVDLDNMVFYVNGKQYQLNANTLQEMIDDDVPFNEKDIANAGNNLNPNYESESFRIVLGEYESAQVSTMNSSEDGKVTSECFLSKIYLPVHEDSNQNILKFNFPLTMTEDELKSNAGEPTDFSEYINEDGTYVSHTYSYKKDSEKYYGQYGYTFEFMNGKLKYVTINYK